MSLFNRISFSEKFFFTKNLAVMLKSGIPISKVVETLGEQTKNAAFKKVLGKVTDDISKGKSLESSLGDYPKTFDPFYLSLIRIGEESGTLEESLLYLVTHLQKEKDLRQKVQGALLYPAIVLIATGGIGFAIAFFILPQIVDLFESLQVKLPITTLALLFVARLLRDWGAIMVPAFVGLVIAVVLVLRSRPVKPLWHRTLLKLPIVGSLFQNISLARLTRNLGIMLKSGLTVTSALETAAQVEGNLVYRRDLTKVSEEVKRGKSIENALSEGHFAEFPLFAIRMIGVGEQSGNLEENLAYLGDYFEEEVDTVTSNLSTILEPVLLIFIGGVVAFVALSIISPIYQVTGSIH